MKTTDVPSSPVLRGSGWTDSSFLKESIRAQAFPVQIPLAQVTLSGDLTIPWGAKGVVLFAHGRGSNRHSPRNQFVARAMQDAGIATLLFDFSARNETELNSLEGELPYDIRTLGDRLVGVTRWIANQTATSHLGISYFGSSTGGAAAMVAAAELGQEIDAVVSRGGRPDLAGAVLARVVAPTLIIVGAKDELVREINQLAFEQLPGKKRFVIIPRATHLFEETGAIEHVATVATAWVYQHLKPR